MSDYRLQNTSRKLKGLLHEIIELTNLRRSSYGNFTKADTNLQAYLNELISEKYIDFDDTYILFNELKKKHSIIKEYADNNLIELNKIYDNSDKVLFKPYYSQCSHL